MQVFIIIFVLILFLWSILEEVDISFSKEVCFFTINYYLEFCIESFLLIVLLFVI